MTERKDFSGALFRNQEKKQDTHADYEGSCLIDGREFWINAWVKESSK